MPHLYSCACIFRSFLLLLLLTSTTVLHAQTESEPNNSFTTANPMAFSTNMSGGVLCTAGDNEDYFRVVQPAGGKSIRLITTASMPAGSGSMYVYLYNKFQGQLANHYLALTTTSLIDTLDFDCFEGDTFYVRVSHWSGGCKSYTIRCESTNVFTLKNDVEYNDNFAAAVPLQFQADSTGHLQSQRYIGAVPSGDGEDYYRCVVPPGGFGIRLATSSRIVTPGATGAMYIYLYNKYHQQLTNLYVTLTSTFRYSLQGPDQW